MNAKLPQITRTRYSGTGGRGCVFFLFFLHFLGLFILWEFKTKNKSLEETLTGLSLYYSYLKSPKKNGNISIPYKTKLKM